MNKKILAVLVILAVLIATVFFIKREKKHSVIFKAPSGKTATITVE